MAYVRPIPPPPDDPADKGRMSARFTVSDTPAWVDRHEEAALKAGRTLTAWRREALRSAVRRLGIGVRDD